MMEKLNYDIIDLLKLKDEMSNFEYIHRVNALVARLLVIHPFEDGNGRVSRALTNFLYKKKHLPIVFINAEKQRNVYLDALSEINVLELRVDDPGVDLTGLDLLMCKTLKTSYSNIYSGDKMLTNPEKEIEQHRLKSIRK